MKYRIQCMRLCRQHFSRASPIAAASFRDPLPQDLNQISDLDIHEIPNEAVHGGLCQDRSNIGVNATDPSHHELKK